MKLRWSSLVGLVAYAAVSLAYAAEPGQPAVSTEANEAIQQMGKTLAQENITFKAKTMRVYQDNDGDYLHIVHHMDVTAHRPDRISVTATGDDGTTVLIYDGKQVSALDATDNKYAQVPMTGNLQQMLDEVSERVGIEFPLADLMSSDPTKSFLTGVISGKEVDTDKIDGVPCRHFFFNQADDLELELWLEDNDRALPRRFVVTYRNLPGRPTFIAELSDWDFSTQVSDTAFVFQPPAGVVQVEASSNAAPAAAR